MKCPQCKSEMESRIFDIGYGIKVNSLHCRKCKFNITENKRLKNAMSALRQRMSKDVKVVRIGTGLGIRFPNDIVKSYDLKKGEALTIKPEADGMKLVASR
ncbi:AbrB/MazE/SpoVT family DNA-binding domain-containing protein [Candidatus Woesearchaeota archaeon]|nr:AbrB/MazE/SpoVT family DNA-binding domain-containing protein [Candidatus Woesearchaeota archaeon]